MSTTLAHIPRRAGLVLALVLAALLVGPPWQAEARSREHVVDQHGSGGYTTLQAAVDAARSGDTILIRPGTYREQVSIDKDLAIAGDGDRAEVIIEASGRGWRRAGTFHFVGGDSSVRGLTIVELAPEVELPPSGIDDEDIYVPDPWDLAPDRPTIAVAKGARAVLEDNEIVGLAMVGVTVEGKGSRLRLAGNVLDETGGVFVGGGARAAIEGNEFSGSDRGIMIDGKGTRAVVESNDFIDVDLPIMVHRRATATIEDNTITRPSVGIEIQGKGTDPDIRANRILDAALSGIDLMAGPGAVVEGNDISGSRTAIRIHNEVRDESYDSVVAKAPTSPTIRGNTISGNGRGITVGTGATPSIIGNTFERNDIAGIDVSDARSRPKIDGNELRENGEAIRVAEGAKPKILDNVIVERAPRDPGVPPTEIVVAGDGTGDVLTITAGVAAAAPGDRVLVRPGIYAESVSIYKDIVVAGDGTRDRVILKVPDMPTLRPALLLDGSDATISGLTIDSDLPPGRSAPFSSEEDWTAAQVRGGAPLLRDVAIKGPTGLLVTDGSNATISGNDIAVSGPAILVAGSATPVIEGNHLTSSDDSLGDATGLIVGGRGTAPTIRNNDITGKLLLGFGASAVVEGNRVDGGMSVLGADHAVVRENRIRIGSGFEPGISSWDCDVAIEDNEIIGDMDTGVFATVFGDRCEPGQPLIAGNSVRATGAGIELRDVPSALVTDNDVLVAGPGIIVSGGPSRGKAPASPGPTIRDNVVRSGSEAIVVDGGTKPRLEGNTIEGGATARRYALGLLDVGGLASPPWSGWSSGGTLQQARAAHTASVLSDGRVLIAGGDQAGEESVTIAPRRTAELFDPNGNGATMVGKLRGPRFEHLAVELDDGSVLVVGGQDQQNRVLGRMERYDPASQRFRKVGTLEPARHELSATRLDDGTVLLAGGNTRLQAESVDVAQLYDPVGGQVLTVGSLNHARAGHTATVLDDGRVLVVGGIRTGIDCFSRPFRKACRDIEPDAIDSSMPAQAELYDPVSRTFSVVEGSRELRHGHTATRLDDGRVLIAGGYNDDGEPLGVVLFDPITERFVPAAAYSQPRHGHTATRLTDGRVLVVGGEPDFEAQIPGLTAEIYDPARDTWTIAGPFQTQRMQHAASQLDDGRVLVSGGWFGEELLIFDPAVSAGLGPLPSADAGGLAASLPGEIGGQPVSISSVEGPAWAERLADCECSMAPLREMQRLLDDRGASLDDVTLATALVAQEAGGHAAVVALQIRGQDAATIQDDITALVLDDLIDPQRSTVQVGAKSVLATTDGVLTGEAPRYSYAAGDTVWIIDAPEPVAMEILESLP